MLFPGQKKLKNELFEGLLVIRNVFNRLKFL